MAWMTPTLPLRAIACASWTTSLKIGTRTTWASLMRCASCGSQINPTKSHCLPVPAGTARAAGTDGPALQLAPPALWQTTEQKAVIGAGGGLGPCMWARQEAMKEQSLLPHPGHGVGRIHPVWRPHLTLEAWPLENAHDPGQCCDGPWSTRHLHHTCLYFLLFRRRKW